MYLHTQVCRALHQGLRLRYMETHYLGHFDSNSVKKQARVATRWISVWDTQSTIYILARKKERTVGLATTIDHHKGVCNANLWVRGSMKRCTVFRTSTPSAQGTAVTLREGLSSCNQ